MNFPWDRVQPEIKKLSDHHPHDAASPAIKAQIDSILIEHLTQTVEQLGQTIGASANQVARGTKIIQEAISDFRQMADKSSVNLSHALDHFRESMDTSSKQMARLTFWLVVFTALLALLTAALVLKELGILNPI
jgi:hypothetical protein